MLILNETKQQLLETKRTKFGNPLSKIEIPIKIKANCRNFRYRSKNPTAHQITHQKN